MYPEIIFGSVLGLCEMFEDEKCAPQNAAQALDPSKNLFVLGTIEVFIISQYQLTLAVLNAYVGK